MDISQPQPSIEKQQTVVTKPEQATSSPMKVEVVQSAQPEQSPVLGRTQPSSTTPAPAAAPANNQVWSHQLHNSSAQSHLDQAIAKLTANDEDLIEKEWVDIAEKVIDVSKDDPKAEDQQQQALNRAYLKKRFNLDIK